MEKTIWETKVKPPKVEGKLTGESEADIVIVGAGVTGLTSAYLLSKAGRRVVVLEKDTIASGESMRTTAFLSYVSDADLSELSKTFGEKKAAEVWRSMQVAIAQIETIVNHEKIDCEFTRCPLFYYPAKIRDRKFLKDEMALIKELGFEVHERKDFREPFKYALEFPNNAKFHPVKYLYGLAEKIVHNGGRIFEHSEVEEYEQIPRAKVKTKTGSVSANHVVIATHNPNNYAFEVHTRLIPANTYVIAGTCSDLVEEGLYVDTEEPYHYFRVDKIVDGATTSRFLLGGEDHKTGETENLEKRHQQLENYLEKFLGKGKFKVTHRWSGQVINTIDGLPFMGEYLFSPSHFLAGTGYAGDGYPFGTLAGMICADQIIGNDNKWSNLYSTKRFRGAGEFLKLNAKFMKELVAGRLRVREGESAINSIEKGSGKVINSRGKKIAVYKSENGEVKKMSAVCTHLGCIVDWNDQAKTWDCPCHGSRYTKDGKVSRGPARKPLKPIE